MRKKLACFETPLQKIELEDISGFDRVLDVGAGGEGLAARIGKEQVYGIDIRVSEIKEVKSKNVDCNWVVCDARKLCFKNETFDLITAWFSLMYITRTEDKTQVLSECKRTLRKGGVLNIKDANVDVLEDVFVLNAQFKLCNGELVNTSYGVSGSQKQNKDLFKIELTKLGFRILEEEAKEYWFTITCKKDI
jgi:ubiquinone/menaquinone biosynthesis C-methylase UbiE